MKKTRQISKILIILVLFILVVFLVVLKRGVNQQSSRLVGEWQYRSENFNFTISFWRENEKLAGSYCYVSVSTIDCPMKDGNFTKEKNIEGTIDGNMATLVLTGNRSLDPKPQVAAKVIYDAKKDTLSWKSGEYLTNEAEPIYIPDATTLIRTK